jgi:hypothetical protein
VPIEIPAASVGRTEVRGTDPAATAALVVGALAVAALVGGMIVLEKGLLN